jgi:thymidine kinase
MQAEKYGTIKIILGCMFSGKTTELIREFREWSSIDKKPLCINYIDDNRYGDIYNNMYNHNELSIECVKVSCLSDVSETLINSSEIILINEGQFFPDLIEYCKLWCDVYNKKIIVSGLDGDYMRKPFGKILELIPYCDYVYKLNAFCYKCKNGKKAPFTSRKSTETEQIIIGGSNNYEALCRNCFNENQTKIHDKN